MAFDVQEIRSQLALDGARPNQFLVRITNPANATADIKIPFMVRASALPESTIAPIGVPYFGRLIKVAGDREFGEWSVTVMNDEDFGIRNAMEQWMNTINALRRNVRDLASASPTLYKSQAQVVQYGKTGVPIREYQFNGLWPSQISPISLDWQPNAGIEEFQITFQYDWWNVSGGITGNSGGE